MSVHIILVTHEKIGKALLNAATTILGQLPLPCSDIGISKDCETKKSTQALLNLINGLNNTDGILILTDIVGATPYNIVRQLPVRSDLQVASGLNLPMLLKLMNYAKLPLEQLAEKAISGGQQGILLCDST